MYKYYLFTKDIYIKDTPTKGTKEAHFDHSQMH